MNTDHPTAPVIVPDLLDDEMTGASRREQQVMLRLEKSLIGLNPRDSYFMAAVLLKDLIDRNLIDRVEIAFGERTTTLDAAGMRVAAREVPGPDHVPMRLYDALRLGGDVEPDVQ